MIFNIKKNKKLSDYNIDNPLGRIKKMDEKQKPEKKFRAGGVTATIWKNIFKKDKETLEFFNVSLERSYKDKEGVWQTTNNIPKNDVPKAIRVLTKAYDHLVISEE